MKLDREHLLNVLDHLKPAIPKKGDDKELLKRLIFTGTDLVVFSEVLTIAWPLKVDFATVVPSEELVQMVERMDDKAVNLAYSKEHLNIASGNIRARLKTEPQHAIITEAQVAVLDVAHQADWYTLPKNFMDAIRMCMYSASKDTSQRQLMCVYISGHSIVACDDYRISRYTLDGEIPFDMLIPATTCAQMARFAFDRYAITDSWYMFLDPNDVLLASRIIVKSYADLTHIMHFMDFEGKKYALPEGIKKHVETVSIMAEGKFDIEQEIKIWLDKGQIKLKGEKETGWAEAVVKDANLDPGGGVIFTINPTFLVEMLALTDNTIMLGPKGVLFKKGPFTQLIAFLDSK